MVRIPGFHPGGPGSIPGVGIFFQAKEAPGKSQHQQDGRLTTMTPQLRAFFQAHDEVAEWLRRWTANPMCSARVGSNPILVEDFFFSRAHSQLLHDPEKLTSLAFLWA